LPGFRPILLIGKILRIIPILYGPGYSDIIERTVGAVTCPLSGENHYSVRMNLPAGKYQGYKYSLLTFPLIEGGVQSLKSIDINRMEQGITERG